MIHVHYAIRRKPGMGGEEFHRYWRDVHGPIARRIPQIRRYVQSHRIALGAEAEDSPFDGVAEVWVDDEAALQDLLRGREYRDGALADEPKFIDMDRVAWVYTSDYVVLEGAPVRRDTSLVKGIFLIKRRPGSSLSEFRRYWKEVHGPIVLRNQGLRRYVQCHPLESSYGHEEPRFDGVAQLWLDDADAAKKMLESTEFKEVSWPDAGKFIDMSSIVSFFCEEQRVIWPS